MGSEWCLILFIVKYSDWIILTNYPIEFWIELLGELPDDKRHRFVIEGWTERENVEEYVGMNNYTLHDHKVCNLYSFSHLRANRL